MRTSESWLTVQNSVVWLSILQCAGVKPSWTEAPSLVVDMTNQRLNARGTHFRQEESVVCESTLCVSITFAVV